MNGTKVIKIANIPSNTNATKPCSILPVQYGVPNLLMYTPLRIGYIPYFVLWCRNFLNSKYVSTSVENSSDANLQYWRGVLYIARTIFYMNYCINFFLYSITGAYFRREVRMLFSYANSSNRREQVAIYKCHRHTPN
jgi:hypothetical protein